tara:strand:+ start:47 stop:232 length:186 start_codon:yes stop_codon:yes gene_type:complete
MTGPRTVRLVPNGSLWRVEIVDAHGNVTITPHNQTLRKHALFVGASLAKAERCAFDPGDAG